jgi:hypothetical protein
MPLEAIMRVATITDLKSHGFSSNFCPMTRQVMPNMTRDFGDYHISYCRYQSHYNSDTTSLVLSGRVFLILNGYHVEAFVLAAERAGILGCFSVFIEMIAHANRLSEHLMAAGLANDPFKLHVTTRNLVGQSWIDELRIACGAKADPAE